MDNSENWESNRKISKVNKWQGRENQRHSRKKSAGECEKEKERAEPELQG